MSRSLEVKWFSGHDDKSLSSWIDFYNNSSYWCSTVGFNCDWCRWAIAVKGSGEGMALGINVWKVFNRIWYKVFWRRNHRTISPKLSYTLLTSFLNERRINLLSKKYARKPLISEELVDIVPLSCCYQQQR